MARMYAVQATVETVEYRELIEYRSGKGLPTFYLHADVQGIISKTYAKVIAREVIGADRYDAVHIHIEEVEI